MPPDSTTPRSDMALLVGVGVIGAIQTSILFPFSFLGSDFGPFCLWAVPGGIALLIINLLVFRDCRRRYSLGEISQVASRYMAGLAILVNAVPMALGLLAFLAGALLSPTTDRWLAGLSPATIIAASTAMTFIFFPFNLLCAVVALAIYLHLRRQDRRQDRPQAA